MRAAVSLDSLHYHPAIFVMAHHHHFLCCGQICDTVAIARHVNATLIIPDLDKSSYWSDSRYVGDGFGCPCPSTGRPFSVGPCGSEFADLFDVDHFIDTLKDEVMILRKLPPKYTRKKGWRMFSTALASWSNVTYYEHVLLPLLRENEVGQPLHGASMAAT